MPNEKATGPVMATFGERVVPGTTGSPAIAAWLVWNSKSRPHWKRTSLVSRGPSTDVNRPITQSALTPSSPQLSTPRHGRGRLHACRRVPAQVVVADGERVVVVDLPVDLREQQRLIAGARDDAGQALHERQAIVRWRPALTPRPASVASSAALSGAKNAFALLGTAVPGKLRFCWSKLKK